MARRVLLDVEMQHIFLVHGTARILPNIARGDDVLGDSIICGRHYYKTTVTERFMKTRKK